MKAGVRTGVALFAISKGRTKTRATHTLAAVLAVSSALGAAPARAATPGKTDTVLRQLAGQVTHGWLHDRMPYPELERRLRARRRVYVTCGTISTLGQRALARRGVRSRLVVTMTREPFNAVDNGHTMLEVRIRGRWVVHDLGSNRQPVSRRGRGIPVTEFVRQRPRRYRLLAHDRALDVRGAADPEYARWVAANLERWYDRVLGTPLVQGRDGLFYFTDESQRARLEGYAPNFRWRGR